MKITRAHLKEIIREELLREVTVKTRSGIKIEMSPVGQKLKIHGFKGNYVEINGRKPVQAFVSALVKNMRIV